MVIIKQDRNGVRTAQDLERKYQFSSLVKAIKIHENTLTKTNTTLDNFISYALGTIEEMQSQIDGEVTTWFYEGVPTLENQPANAWTTDEEKNKHLGDMYYDKDTGYAYRFSQTDGVYSWLEIKDNALSEALAIANKAQDTADNKRRVFVDTPYPPYENGDLWVKDEEIYICQISKTEEETYAEDDFIIATKYTDDTVANQVGDELRVLQGTVLTVKEGVDEFKVTVEDRDKATQSSIQLLKNAFATLITDENGESLMQQNPDGVTYSFSMKSVLDAIGGISDSVETLGNEQKTTNEEVEKVTETVNALAKTTEYIKIGTRDGKPCIELGESDSAFKLIITNEAILFTEGTSIPAYVSNKALHIKKAVIDEELHVGGFVLSKRSNGNVGFMWKGDNL